MKVMFATIAGLCLWGVLDAHSAFAVPLVLAVFATIDEIWKGNR